MRRYRRTSKRLNRGLLLVYGGALLFSALSLLALFIAIAQDGPAWLRDAGMLSCTVSVLLMMLLQRKVKHGTAE